MATSNVVLFTEAQMHELTEIVAPKVMAEWERLAYCMRYGPEKVKAIRKESHDLRECCMKLFHDWLTTGHGPEPKTYQTLLNCIKKIKDLITASEEIEKELIQGRDKQYINIAIKCIQIYIHIYTFVELCTCNLH